MTTTSVGVQMFANCVFISDRTYSYFSGYTGAHAFSNSLNTTSSQRLTSRSQRSSASVAAAGPVWGYLQPDGRWNPLGTGPSADLRGSEQLASYLGV